MNSIELKPLIESAINEQWTDFASRHPALAQVLDRDLLVESVSQSLADDVGFQQSLLEAHQLGTAAESIAAVVSGAVRRLLSKLI